ncbi:FCS-Like Zinc finger 15-like [Hibiscus syriacus]|uniref:FCS-Like Zinc finger 15-like n=1 Tax=Hibiscus syriacus TaxID=106335 RepID=UPI001920F19A|nr:FCS-Like Zinc finger 15-like [Hibiscus syriacus]
MVGLSVVLEKQNSGTNIISKKNPQVISKTSMLITTITGGSGGGGGGKVSFVNSQSNYAVSPFLQQCFLCKRKLLPAQDIYMYQGDRGFCSVECRCRQIMMDEEETLKKEKCSFAAMKPSSSSSSAVRRRHESGRS